MKRALATFSLVVLAATTLLHQGAAQAQEKKFRLGVMKIAAMTTPYVAKEQGFFKKHGLDVELVIIRSGAEGINALQGGNVDATLAIPSFAMAANERKFDLAMVLQNELAHAAPPDSGGIIVAKDSKITKLSELAGMTVGVNSLHAQEAVDAQYVIRKAGVPKDKVKYVEVPFPSMGDVLARKQADAVVAIDPFTSMLQLRGGRAIAWEYVDSIPEQPIGTFWAKRPWAEKNMDVMDAFTASMEEAIAYMNADPKRARAQVAEFTRLPPDVVEAMPMIVWSTKINVAKWRELIELLRSMGELEQNHSPDEYFSSGVKRRLGIKG
jgi:NitT/TauT family transport system substrate-binding protein